MALNGNLPLFSSSKNHSHCADPLPVLGIINTTGFLISLDNVLSGKTLKVDSKQFAYYSIPDEMGIQNEHVKSKRKRVLFSLNVQPQYENAIIDAQIEFIQTL